MIIYRALYREASQASVAIVVVLLVVLVFFGLTAVLGRAARGEYAASIVFSLITWQTIKRFDVLIPLAFYLGALLTLSRWYRDSEMTVLAACGVGLPQLLRPLMVLAAVVAVLSGVATFYVTPLSYRHIEMAKAESAQRPQLAGVTPGAFNDAAAGGRIIYAESVEHNGMLENVFLSKLQGRAHVVLARRGYPFTDTRTGDRFVALEDGWAYEGTPGQADYRILAFDTYAVRLESRPPLDVPTTLEGLPSRLLWARADRSATAEWHWRLSKVIVVPVLAAFALVLAYTDARRGRLSNLFVAVLVYFIYSNLIGIGTTLLKKGQIPAALGLWWVHVLFAGIAAYLLFRRAANKPLLSLPQLARSA